MYKYYSRLYCKKNFRGQKKNMVAMEREREREREKGEREKRERVHLKYDTKKRGSEYIYIHISNVGKCISAEENCKGDFYTCI